jgi:hypothetical protein
MEQQLRGAIAAPEWEPSDWEWRPTVVPGQHDQRHGHDCHHQRSGTPSPLCARTRGGGGGEEAAGGGGGDGGDKAAACGGGGGGGAAASAGGGGGGGTSGSRARAHTRALAAAAAPLLSAVLASHTALATPRAALRALPDAGRLRFYSDALECCLRARPHARVLVLSSSGTGGALAIQVGLSRLL